jgi:hypothetical protein
MSVNFFIELATAVQPSVILMHFRSRKIFPKLNIFCHKDFAMTFGRVAQHLFKLLIMNGPN